MSMTDPIADLLTRIRNAQQAKHGTVDVPGSRMKAAIVKILESEGYIAGFRETEREGRKVLEVRLKYGDRGERAITGLERVSRPGRRVYRGKDEMPAVLGGLGITIVSTPRGVMTGTSCRQQGVGGEVLCNVW